MPVIAQASLHMNTTFYPSIKSSFVFWGSNKELNWYTYTHTPMVIVPCEFVVPAAISTQRNTKLGAPKSLKTKSWEDSRKLAFRTRKWLKSGQKPQSAYLVYVIKISTSKGKEIQIKEFTIFTKNSCQMVVNNIRSHLSLLYPWLAEVPRCYF